MINDKFGDLIKVGEDYIRDNLTATYMGEVNEDGTHLYCSVLIPREEADEGNFDAGGAMWVQYIKPILDSLINQLDDSYSQVWFWRFASNSSLIGSDIPIRISVELDKSEDAYKVTFDLIASEF